MVTVPQQSFDRLQTKELASFSRFFTPLVDRLVSFFARREGHFETGVTRLVPDGTITKLDRVNLFELQGQ